MDSLVLSNTFHRPARTFVSVLGVAVGVLLVVFTVGLAHGVLRERGRREGSIGAQIIISGSGTFSLSGSNPFNLPVSHVSEIKSIEGVRTAVPLGQNTVPSDSGFGTRLIDGINFKEYADMAGLKMLEGRGLLGDDEAIVDSVWIKENNSSLGKSLTIYERPFRVVGIYEPPGGARVKIPLATMQDQVGAENRCARILVSCINPELQKEVAARIHRAFPDDQVIFTRDLPDIYAVAVPALNIFINVVVGVAATVSTLVILLAMYTTVTERTRQIGILKSLGMPSLSIAWVIEKEAILVSVLGLILGLVLTLLARFAVSRFTSMAVSMEPRWIVTALLIGLVAGSLGALYPAIRAARQDAVEALNYE